MSTPNLAGCLGIEPSPQGLESCWLPQPTPPIFSIPKFLGNVVPTLGKVLDTLLPFQLYL